MWAVQGWGFVCHHPCWRWDIPVTQTSLTLACSCKKIDSLVHLARLWWSSVFGPQVSSLSGNVTLHLSRRPLSHRSYGLCPLGTGLFFFFTCAYFLVWITTSLIFKDGILLYFYAISYKYSPLICQWTLTLCLPLSVGNSAAVNMGHKCALVPARALFHINLELDCWIIY